MRDKLKAFRRQMYTKTEGVNNSDESGRERTARQQT